MSHTDNTMPADLQEEDGTTFGFRGGDYAGIGKATRYEEKSARQRARLALQRGEEPEPARHRRNQKWMWW